MRCPKCGRENSATVQFCVGCHAPLRFTCPACHHRQDHGGQCDQCEVDFAKYATLLVLQAQTQAQQEREDLRQTRNSLLKQIVLLPITGWVSLLGFLGFLRRRR